MSQPTAYLFAALLLVATPASAQKATISKCQDATGKWHYGDNAADACAKSNVTVINERGIKKKEIAAPASSEDIKRREAIEAEQVRAKERSKQDQILLSTYSHEADITFVRDRRIAQIESNIKAGNETLASLRKSLERAQAQEASERKSGAVSQSTTIMLQQNQQQVANHEASIAQMRHEQDEIRQRAEADLKRYRELRASTATPDKP